MSALTEETILSDLKERLETHFKKSGFFVDPDNYDDGFLTYRFASLGNGKLCDQDFDTIVSVVINSQCCTYGCDK